MKSLDWLKSLKSIGIVGVNALLHNWNHLKLFGSEEVSSSEVEICALARYSSQLQLSPSPKIRSVGWSVNNFRGEPRARFLSFFAWMFLTIRIRKWSSHFFQKKSGSLIIHENVSKIMVFGHFFKDYSLDLDENAYEYSL